MKKNANIRVLIVDDSVLMRILIKDILAEDASMEVVGIARNGKEALEMCHTLDPDVVLMDITMGEFDGVYGVREIMKEVPRPIIILSAIGNTDMGPVMDALSAGAVDFLNKPAQDSTGLHKVGGELIQKIHDAASIGQVKVQPVVKKVNVNPHTFTDEAGYDVIVIGASTGGPTAVEMVLSNLPGNLNVPVVVVQHMPSHFIPSFVARLNTITPLEVVVGRKGDVVSAGKIVVAPGNRNMILERNEQHELVVDFTTEKFREYNHPSVSAVMLSAAATCGARCIGVILTGMGKDGSQGMRAIKQAGGYTVAQHKDTCVVYGMPRAAVEDGSVNAIVPLAEIGGFVVSCLS
ncbi:MAG: chemotaxis-specific protein-glutamate methyltransferase CheB [Bacteroidia bacterium]|nr:chemotaxis-specific protein-glutamate methyltransferase CheB [Bacteroidia bacterium]